ncbi:O-antigen ligase family protein [Termitidicoccus mucosus]|uniref:O-antigen ligase-related domain-containing protein n=1 Tax=Termitidicoccus mucosus TaxID=1184151 RepID=A0A178IP76_9BACT|nr:hypothetical protein AW736_01865 [Opitutaceae bacterium TSB47]
MSPTYFFNGNLRWGLFWENPNCAAAFLACALGWIWWLEFFVQGKVTGRARTGIGIALLLVELTAWFLLAKTYSRGGLVAAVSTLLFFFVLHGSTGMGLTRIVRHIAFRLTAITILCLSAGFAGRMSPGYIARDDSVLNRMELWQGALAMVGDSPFRGWGNGFSGMAYSNWYQPLDATARPTGMVNSYLEVAVEHGIHTLFIIILCLFVLFSIVAGRRDKNWIKAAGACLAAWCVSNIWSSQWKECTLWILPGISILCILAAGWRMRESMGKMAVISLGGSLLVTALLLGLGRVLANKRAFRAVPLSQSDIVAVSTRSARMQAGPPGCELWIDGAVFGNYWGKTLRSIFRDAPVENLIVYAPWTGREKRMGDSPRISIYSGFQAELIGDKKISVRKTVILHPMSYPPDSGMEAIKYPSATVCLPQIDASSYGLPWRHWATETGASLVYSPQGGVMVQPDADPKYWLSLFYDE